MPLYYFDTDAGVTFHDTEGSELADIRAAQVEAYRVLCQLIPVHEARLIEGNAFTLTVSDERRMRLFTLDLQTTLAPGLRSS